MSDLQTGTIEVTVEDGGGAMAMYFAHPKKAERALPGIIVFQEAFGVNNHIKDVARRFAEEGYFAVAPELFHRTAAKGAVFDYGNFPAVMPHFQAMTPQALEADSRAAYEWLKTRPETKGAKIGAIGYCLGGRATFVANSALPLSAALSYYGGRIAPDLLNLAPKQHGPIAFLWGGKDAHIPAEQRRAVADAMSAAGKSFVNLEFYDADHAFFCDDRPAYHRDAAREAWAFTLEFLRIHLK